jgi:hypothetical protein
MATVSGPMTRYSRGEPCRQTSTRYEPGNMRDFPGDRVGDGERNGER